MSSKVQTTIAPHTLAPVVTRTYPSDVELDALVDGMYEAQKKWAAVSLEERIRIGWKFVEIFDGMKDDIPAELTMQMGRPISQCPGEVRGTLDRARYMLSIASSSLSPYVPPSVPSLPHLTSNPSIQHLIRREPLGLVLLITPWNYPYLVLINTLLPALIAGNAVLVKPAPQTPLCAERMVRALVEAGVPNEVVGVVHTDEEGVRRLVGKRRRWEGGGGARGGGGEVAFVSFTGSVKGGESVEGMVREAGGFRGVGLELGGKDPAYVRADADLEYTIEQLVDGAYFNSGQSCCAVERIYVHQSIYEKFVTGFVELAKKYKLGDPTDPSTTLGPVVSVASADRIRKQVEDAVKAGAKKLVPEELFAAATPGTAYVAPQVLVDVNHSMEIMTEETFGPIVGIQPVSSDSEAIALMNDSRYGLTASVWTDIGNADSKEAFERVVREVETGTVFLNRCDYLDPSLAWTGVKDSGRGVSLSKFGYDQLTRAKSVHMKVQTRE